jgi:hypothetical protein
MKKLVAILLLMLSTSCFGYIVHVEVLSNGQHKIFLFSDNHAHNVQPTTLEEVSAIKEKKLTSDTQRMELIEAAKKLNAPIVVEDVLFGSDEQYRYNSSLEKLGSAMQNDFKKDPLSFDANADYQDLTPDITRMSEDNYSALSPLFFLSQFCKKNNVSSDNIEFRFASPEDYKIEDRVNIYKKKIAAIKAFNDNVLFNKIYEEKMGKFEEKYHPLEKTLERILTPPLMTDLDYVSRHTNAETEIPMSVNLINLKILHSIYSYGNQKNIFVCVGGDHAKNVGIMLVDSLGYKKESEHGSRVWDAQKEFLPNAVDLQCTFSIL